VQLVGSPPSLTLTLLTPWLGEFLKYEILTQMAMTGKYTSINQKMKRASKKSIWSISADIEKWCG
jgi:hypothetical protein